MPSLVVAVKSIFPVAPLSVMFTAPLPLESGYCHMVGMPKSSVDTINHINIGLMIVSCAAAFALPFELFLFSYAVLGPLHYLTQIAWMHDRGYFTRDARSKRWWLLLVAAAMIVVLYGIAASL